MKFNSPRTIFGMIGVAVLVTALFMLLHKKEVAHKIKETPFVAVEAVKQQDVMIYADAVGSVEANVSAAVKSHVDGELKKINFKEGEFVKKGQILFEIDPRQPLVKLHEAEATLARDKADLAMAIVTVNRNSLLVGKGYVARQDFDQFITKQKTLTATVKADQALLDEAKLQLSYCTIVSPMNGRSGKVSLSVGELVHQTDPGPLVTINQISPIDIIFALPEKYFEKIKAQLAHGDVWVEAFLGATLPKKVSHKGKIIFSDNTVDLQTGMIQYKALFKNEDQYFWPGQFVKVKLPVDYFKQAILVPTRAIAIGAEGPYVFVVGSDHIAQIRPITLGETVDDTTIITKGLAPDELVITEGQLRLVGGSKVKYTKST